QRSDRRNLGQVLGTRLWIERNSPNAEYRRASTHRNQRPYAPGNLTLASAVSNFAGVEPDRQPELAEGQSQLQVWVSIPAAQRQLRRHPRSAGRTADQRRVHGGRNVRNRGLPARRRRRYTLHDAARRALL